jgi:hypothetical protein
LPELPDSKAASDSLSVLSKPDLALARETAKVRAVERAATLGAWNDYVGFGVSKLAGISALIVGGLEYLDPNTLTAVVPRPGLIIGTGLALLTGKNIVSLVARLDRSNK